MYLNEVFNPMAIIVAYRKKGDVSSSREEDVYIECASIKNNKVGAFTPLSRKVAKDLGDALVGTSNISVGGLVPENVLYVSFNVTDVELMWYSEPQRMTLFYAPDLQIPNGEFPLPWLVWYVCGRQLFIHASKEKPGLKTALYKAPFHNTSYNGLVCMGSANHALAKKFQSFNKTIETVESAFYESIFTHTQDNKITIGNINQIHKRLIESKGEFDYSVLVKREKQTISSLLKIRKDEIEDDDDTSEESESE